MMQYHRYTPTRPQSPAKSFEYDVRNYYNVSETSCRHDDAIYTLWFQDREEHGIYSFETDSWTKFTYCEKCVKWMTESAACSGEYMNFRLFRNDIDVSDDYNLVSNLLKISVLFFSYYDDDDKQHTFVLRKRDFQFYERYFYKYLKTHYYDGIKVNKALNRMPDIKKKFWNVHVI